MAVPMTADQFVKALKAEGVKVAERAGWRTHNRNHKGAWGNVNGVVIHHTAGTNSLALCSAGTSALPGPLCHTHLAKSGTATMVGHGRANHAGTFAANAFNAMLNEAKTHPRPDAAEPIDANARTYGIEIENLGNGKDFYPQAQYDAAVRWAAAICRFHGWSEHSVIGHAEGTRRKIDPKGPVGKAGGPMWDMDKFRADVAKVLAGKPGAAPAPTKPAPTPPKENTDVSKRETSDAVWEQDVIGAPESSPTKATNPTWKASSFLREIYDMVREIRDAVRELRDAKR
ncbi:N-acetylmuramoyl-L-alanine amidase [Streptomyces albidoflavus]|uniref:N-acetylmuramoyl-L-alanine amidase n=1 Tax=Streptomyces albidoflavus TaxID=1886 RepID=UPI00386D75E5|nr:N-acetylmuramoyl-L-alanine amidase [Streptomyces albidoflavus]